MSALVSTWSHCVVSSQCPSPSLLYIVTDTHPTSSCPRSWVISVHESLDWSVMLCSLQTLWRPIGLSSSRHHVQVAVVVCLDLEFSYTKHSRKALGTIVSIFTEEMTPGVYRLESCHTGTKMAPQAIPLPEKHQQHIQVWVCVLAAPLLIQLPGCGLEKQWKMIQVLGPWISSWHLLQISSILGVVAILGVHQHM